MRAFCLIRDQPWYRRQAFEAGLKAAGYQLQAGHPERTAPGDVLVIWNRYHDRHELATRFEAQGGTVIVAENGYLGRGGSTPKFDVHPGGPTADSYYAIAVGGHNGSGLKAPESPERWAALGVELQPWRSNSPPAGGGVAHGAGVVGDNRHVLVCPSRSFGRPDMTMPKDWVQRTVAELRKFTKRPIRVREHPENNRPARPLSEDLAGAHAVVIWASSAGIHALVAGIPVFRTAPHWILKGADSTELGAIESPPLPDRLPAFHRLSAAQWAVREIESGEPFRRLR